MIERAVACRVVSLFERHFRAHFAAVFDHAIDPADVAADKKQVTNSHVADIIGRRRWRIGQVEAQRFEFIFDLHGNLLG